MTVCCAEVNRCGGRKRVIEHFTARGWKAYRVDNPDESESPELAFYCPDCAARELGKPA